MFLKHMLTTRNVGTFDRVLRAIPAIAVPILWSQGIIGNTLASVLGVVAVMLLVSALTGACSIYYMLGWSSCSVSGKTRE